MVEVIGTVVPAVIAYESSAETLDYHMEQEERQQEAKAILDQMKNARK